MRIVNTKLLKEGRPAGLCERCWTPCGKREYHHLFCAGMGAGSRLDIRINLIAFGASRPYPRCPCHRLCHEGKVPRRDLLRIVAARENTTPDAIETVIPWLLRLDKHASPDSIERSLAIIKPLASDLARRVLVEAGKLESSNA